MLELISKILEKGGEGFNSGSKFGQGQEKGLIQVLGLSGIWICLEIYRERKAKGIFPPKWKVHVMRVQFEF